MPTTYSKTLNQGTSNPIVARTTVQPNTIIGPFPIPAESKARILSINGSLCNRLLAMEGFANWLAHECDAIRDSLLSRGLKKIGEDAFETPYIIDLDTRVESYLQAAKLSIRDCGFVVGSLVGKPFDHKYHKIVNWAKGKFGDGDAFVQWLAAQHSWVSQVVDMRNALEHPVDEPRGRLHIRNADFIFSEDKVSGAAPVWFLTGEPPTSILIDTQNLNVKILLLAEDLLASTVLKLFPEVPIVIQEIPDEQRDPKCSVRLKLAPRGCLVGVYRW